MSASHASQMADAAFHARTLRHTLERAQGKAPEAERPAMDEAIRLAELLRCYASRQARVAAARGGIRQAG